MAESTASLKLSPLLTVRQLAELLQVSTRTVWRMQSAGELPEPIRISHRVRWRRDDVEEWLRRQSS